MMRSYIIGLGYRAQQGKNTAANFLQSYLKEIRPQLKVKQFSFATKLRQEIDELCNNGKTIKELCEQWNVEYDPNPIIDKDYPYGKQRRLLQVYGTDYRRGQNPRYWLDFTKLDIITSQVDIAIITDVRFWNEAEFCRGNGTTVKVENINSKYSDSSHSSVHELDNWKFRYHIKASTLDELKYQSNKVIRRLINYESF